MAQIPLFALKNCFNFDGNVLGQMFTCKKDMYYRFLSNEDIHWRQLLYSFNRRFLSRIAMSSGSVKSTDPRCLIADDTDFPRTGRKGGLLGLVFSHIKHESSLDYKVFFSCSLMERHKPSWTSGRDGQEVDHALRSGRGSSGMPDTAIYTLCTGH